MLNQKLNNILISIPCLMLGGTEYQTLNLVKALVKNNYNVTVLCYFEYDERMISYMKEEGADVILLSNDGIRTQGIKNTLIFLFKGFKKVLKEVKPSLVHVQYLAPGSLSIILFKLLGVKNIITTAHVPGHIYKRKIVPKILARFFTDAFICVSKSSERDFFEIEPKLYSKIFFNKGRKHFTIYNCTNTDVEIIKKENDIFNIGIVSRLSFEKGIDKIIDALPFILNENQKIKLTIVGDGNEKEKLISSVDSKNLENYVSFEGLQPKENLQDYYNSFDLVVIPSRFEAFGLTAIEAMSYEVPIVSSKTDGLKEVIEDKVSGILVSKEKSEEYAKEILTLIKKKEIRKTIGKNGRKRVLDNFSFDRFEEKTISLYKQILKGTI
jgi:glycosyltransferase involved in cell wall biosynthesis